METEFTPSGSIVFVSSILEPQDLGMPPYFGYKAVLKGDTYDLLSSGGENLKAELDWDETHLTFNDEVGNWVIDADAVDELEEVLADHGHQLGGFASELVEVFEDEEFRGDTWKDVELDIEVTYESGRSGDTKTKSGIIEVVDPSDNEIGFVRDDDTYMKIVGNELRTPMSHYPYVGDIEKVEVDV